VGEDSGEVLNIRGLRVDFHTKRGVVRAVRGLDLSVRRAEIVGVVGETGCGKSVTALSVLRLIPRPGVISAGWVMFHNQDLLRLPEKHLRSVRGNRISMIFQEPSSSLNPVFRVADQIAEVLRFQVGLAPRVARGRAVDLMREVGIPDADVRARCYPHQLSGGMNQRIMIAMALACSPEILIADEPVTALDATIKGQILSLLRQLRDRHGSSIVLITHDLGIVAHTCDRVAVMYMGRVVEAAPVDVLFRWPLHPYTRGLLGSLPGLHLDRSELQVIPGSVPGPYDLPAGCSFHPRCAIAGVDCPESEPVLADVGDGHLVACHCDVGGLQ